MTDERRVKPLVVISRCLELEPVRYNGELIRYDFVRQLQPWVTYVPVCPELEIGLGVPRDPVRIVKLGGEARLRQPATGRDLTERMQEFADEFLSGLGEVDGFLLKSRSPSCGVSDVKIYRGVQRSASGERGAGLFTARVVASYPGLAIEDEVRLLDYRIREHFLTKLFALARFRRVKKAARQSELVRFHSVNKLLLMAYNQKQMRLLGRIVANHERLARDELMTRYEQHLQAALARPPRYTSVIKVFEHAAGSFKQRLSRREKALFGSALKRYRARRVPAGAVSAILKAWMTRFGEDDLAPQTIFEPYPADLLSVSDSGKGREV